MTGRTEPGAVAAVTEPRRRGGLLRQRDFRLYWTGDAVSQIGTQISLLAIPLIAVLLLDASPFQVGLLVAVEFLGFLVVGLPAGAWCDRRRRRPIMVVADFVRCALLASIPIASAFDVLTLGHLLAVALLLGIATVFFDVAAQSYLPSLIPPADLVEGNAKLQANQSVALVAGPTVAGALVQALTAPVAIAFDAASFLVSALNIAAIRKSEPEPDRPRERHLGREIAEGIGIVLNNPILRTIASATATLNFFTAFFAAVIVIFLARELDLSPGAIGALMSAGGLGGVLAAIVAGRINRRFGQTRSVWLPLTVGVPLGLLIPVTQRGPLLVMFVVGWFGFSFALVAYNIAQVTVRQQLCPRRLLGRMNATMRFLSWGVMPVGALLGGALGESIGVRPTLWVIQIGQLLAPAILLLSPLRTLRSLPALTSEDPDR